MNPMIYVEPADVGTVSVNLVGVPHEEVEAVLALFSEEIPEATADDIIMRAEAMSPDQQEVLLRRVAPILGRFFQSHRNSLEGLSPGVVRVSKHLQGLLAEAFQQGTWLGHQGPGLRWDVRDK